MTFVLMMNEVFQISKEKNQLEISLLVWEATEGKYVNDPVETNCSQN